MPAADPAAAAPPAAPPRRRGPLLALAALFVGGLGLIGWFGVTRLFFEETDDAYVHADIVSMIPKVAAYVQELRITDNSRFRKGDLLVQLDPRDFENAVASSEAGLAAARADKADTGAMLVEQQDAIGRAQAAIAGDQATSAFAREQLRRYTTLAGTGFGTEQRKQQAQSDIGQRDADLRRDEAALTEAQSHLRTLQVQLRARDAAIDRAAAGLAQARLNLSYTRLSAVADGSVADREVQTGNFVQPGQLLFSAVPDEVYIFANYKETQVARMQVGQRVLVHVDALPVRFLHAHVDSFQRGTGSTFALLPPENATGNFVKVVQRIPVKIRFDEPASVLARVAPGMSVETSVEVDGRPPSWLAWLAGLPV